MTDTIKLIKTFFATLIIFLSFDTVWLGVIARRFYNQELSSFTRALKWPAVIFTYSLISLGITVFVLSEKSADKGQVFFLGALFGLIVYGVYDFTNLAILVDWSLKMTVVDIFWGVTVCGLTSLIVALLLFPR
jgi:uncharacterized membrane protein